MAEQFSYIKTKRSVFAIVGEIKTYKCSNILDLRQNSKKGEILISSMNFLMNINP